jgi:cytidylate kinase
MSVNVRRETMLLGFVSKVAEIDEVRTKLVRQQMEKTSIVMDG